MIRPTTLAIALVAAPATAAPPEWAHDQSTYTSDGAIDVRPLSNPDVLRTTLLNPTGSGTQLSADIAAQPPLLIVQSNGGTVSGAIQLDNGNVWVRDDGYGTWVQVPNAAWAANFAADLDPISANAWGSFTEPVGTVNRSLSYTIGCTPPAVASGTSWPFENFTTTFSRTFSATQTLFGSATTDWQESKAFVTFVDPMIGGGAAKAAYATQGNLTYTWGALSVTNPTVAGLINDGTPFCGGVPPFTRSVTGSVGVINGGAVGLLKASALASDRWAIVCTNPKGTVTTSPAVLSIATDFQSCRIGTFDGGKSFLVGTPAAKTVIAAGNTPSLTFVSKSVQMFFKSSNILYSVNKEAGTIEALGNIGSALPTAAYTNIQRK